MNIKGLIAFIGFTALVIAGGILLYDYSHNSPRVVYRGDATFTTEEEYVAFKEYATQPEITIEDIQVLASEPPIWVRYRIEAPRGYEPPPAYDSINTATGNRDIVYCAMLGGGIAGMALSGAWAFSKD